MPEYRSGLWTAQEDSVLRQSVAFYGPHDWAQISYSISGRTSKQCRERFLNYLRPGLDHSPISSSEGKFIEHMVAKIGTQWSTIAHQLRGRSGNTIKNWWKRNLARRRHMAHIQSNMKDSPINQASNEHSASHSGRDVSCRIFPYKIQPTRTVNPYATSSLLDRPHEPAQCQVLGSIPPPAYAPLGTGVGRNMEHSSTSDYPSLTCPSTNDTPTHTPSYLLHHQLTLANPSKIQAATTNASGSITRISNTSILPAVHGPINQQLSTERPQPADGNGQLSPHLKKAQAHFYDAMVTHFRNAGQPAAPTVGFGHKPNAYDHVLLPHRSEKAETSTEAHKKTSRSSIVLPSVGSRTRRDPLTSMMSTGNSIGL